MTLCAGRLLQHLELIGNKAIAIKKAWIIYVSAYVAISINSLNNVEERNGGIDWRNLDEIGKYIATKSIYTFDVFDVFMDFFKIL